MASRLTWDESKRRLNLAKHGLDFADAVVVLDSRYRLDVPVVRGGEQRVQSLAYALGVMAVLTVVHVPRDGTARIISFRRASVVEREMYRVWLDSEHHDP
ncbi:BrnT family toxin [uncultured Rhodospira sp.]|uniref:BrnT family toxin n=1 Tax=uncultured Rhodospira sp. TaxID=1936189 RepID=UPI002603BA22|nr:BrnT family toxin [uncultured Rhodospira sp.]